MTEGPWTVIDRHFEPRYVVKLDVPGDEGGGYTGICQPDNPDDCYVIAAAPAMLETLTTIANFATGNGDVCEIIARRARAAINLAYPPEKEGKPA